MANGSTFKVPGSMADFASWSCLNLLNGLNFYWIFKLVGAKEY